MTVVTNPACTNSDEEIVVCDTGASTSNFDDHSAIQTDDSGRRFDESQSNVIEFLVPTNDGTWSYIAHRHVLAAASPVFEAILKSNKSNALMFDHVDHRGFEQLMHYYHCEPTQLDSLAVVKCTLEASHKFLCPPLVERCVKKLDEFLDASVALDILRDLRYLCTRLPGVPTAPPLSALSNDKGSILLAQCSRWCVSLAHNVLLVIDENADAVLSDERLEELTYEDLALIVKRDTLQISNEMILIEALSRWSAAACTRINREVTSSNKRTALGELSYCPRYLLLSGEELESALALELLESVERTLVLARARNLPTPLPVSPQQEALLRQWARPRPKEPATLPINMSARSVPPNVSRSSKLCCRKAKRPKEPSFMPNDDQNKRGCCACFGEGLLKAIICLFE